MKKEEYFIYNIWLFFKSFIMKKEYFIYNILLFYLK